MLQRAAGSPSSDHEQTMYKWAVDMWRQQDDPNAVRNKESFRLMAGIICKTTGLSPVDAVLMAHLAEREASLFDGEFDLGEAIVASVAPTRASRVMHAVELIGRNMNIIPLFPMPGIPIVPIVDKATMPGTLDE
jgi:hypothetical protein